MSLFPVPVPIDEIPLWLCYPREGSDEITIRVVFKMGGNRFSLEQVWDSYDASEAGFCALLSRMVREVGRAQEELLLG